MQIKVRKGTKEDMAEVFELICELAAFERAPEQVTNTVSDMIRDGFSEPPVFYCLVAEAENKIAGMAIYFIKYSTWKGKGIYLEDIVVKESLRGKNIGRKLFDAVIEEAILMNAKQLHWQVLDWNESAINFYKKYKADLDTEWINCKLTSGELLTIKNDNTL